MHNTLFIIFCPHLSVFQVQFLFLRLNLVITTFGLAPGRLELVTSPSFGLYPIVSRKINPQFSDGGSRLTIRTFSHLVW